MLIKFLKPSQDGSKLAPHREKMRPFKRWARPKYCLNQKIYHMYGVKHENHSCYLIIMFSFCTNGNVGYVLLTPEQQIWNASFHFLLSVYRHKVNSWIFCLFI